MNKVALRAALFDELRKITEARTRQDKVEKAIDTGMPILGGASAGRLLSDLSLSTTQGASPRRRTLGAVIGGLGGLGYHLHYKNRRKKKAARTASTLIKTSDAFTFKGMATKRFLSKPGKSIHDLSPKIGRMGSLPT